MGIGIEFGTLATDLHLLALLQHHEVPTRLLDVASNPMTAVWFACQTPRRRHGEKEQCDPDGSGVLFAFDVSDLPEYPTVDPTGPRTWSDLQDPLSASLDNALQGSEASRRPFLLRSSLPDARMLAQEGLFIAGSTPSEAEIQGIESFPMPASSAPDREELAALFSPEERSHYRPRELPFIALIIPSGLKESLLVVLEATYNRGRPLLFPDLDGFADALRRKQVNLERELPRKTRLRPPRPPRRGV